MAEAPVDRRKIVIEISVFLIGMGLLIGGLGGVSVAYIPASAKPVLGVARHLAFGVPLLAVGGVLLLSGIVFLATRKTVFAAIGAVALALISVMSFVVSGINLGSGLFVVGALVIAQRLSVLGKAEEKSPPPS